MGHHGASTGRRLATPRALPSPRPLRKGESAVSRQVQDLLEAWSAAERQRDAGPQSGEVHIEAQEAVERARAAYYAAISNRSIRNEPAEYVLEEMT